MTALTFYIAQRTIKCGGGATVLMNILITQRHSLPHKINCLLIFLCAQSHLHCQHTLTAQGPQKVLVSITFVTFRLSEPKLADLACDNSVPSVAISAVRVAVCESQPYLPVRLECLCLTHYSLACQSLVQGLGFALEHPLHVIITITRCESDREQSRNISSTRS